MTAEVEVSERVRWLRRNMATWLLAVVLLVVALVVGTTWTLGVFTSASVNARNVVSAGSMSQVNSADNEAIMGAVDMVPGNQVTGVVSIQNAGDARGDFVLTADDVHDTPGSGGGKLSGRLQLQVFEGNVEKSIYTGLLVDLDVDLGTWKPDEERSYRFVVTLPGGSSGAGNSYQGSRVTATFVWDAVQTH